MNKYLSHSNYTKDHISLGHEKYFQRLACNIFVGSLSNQAEM